MELGQIRKGKKGRNSPEGTEGPLSSISHPPSYLHHQPVRLSAWLSSCHSEDRSSQRCRGFSSVTQRVSGTVWMKSEESPAPNSHSCHCIRLIRSEGTGSSTGHDTSEKWNTSCHIRKQRCQSSAVAAPWMVSW